MSPIKPVILAYKKTEIDVDFREFLKKYQPLGLIVMQENCHSPAQLREFIQDFRDCVGREDAPVSIDQEGGRVQRLAGPIHFDHREPHPRSKCWPHYPEAALIGRIYRKDEELGKQVSRQAGRAIASVLASLAIDLNYAPVADIPLPDADPIISDRAYAREPHTVTVLAREFISGLHQFGVKSCVKHFPGHGRAKMDSHKALPVISTLRPELEKTDLLPFRALCGDSSGPSTSPPWVMAGHMLIESLDSQNSASQSQYILNGILRQELGFAGVICSDCIWMEALKGSLPDRARLSQQAGCDVIIAVQGNLTEQAAILEAVQPISDRSLERLANANLQVPIISGSMDQVKTDSRRIDQSWQSEYRALQQLVETAGYELQALSQPRI